MSIQIRKCYVITGLSDSPQELFVAESDLKLLRGAIDEVLELPTGTDPALPILTVERAVEHVAEVQNVPNEEEEAFEEWVSRVSPMPNPTSEQLAAIDALSMPSEEELADYDRQGAEIRAELEHVDEPAPPSTPEPGKSPAPTRDDKIEAKYKKFIGEGMTPQKAIGRLAAFFSGVWADEFRAILRARGHEIPDPMSYQERNKRNGQARSEEMAKTPIEQRIAERYKILTDRGETPGRAISTMMSHFRPKTAAELRTICRQQGIDVPEPANPADRFPKRTKPAPEVAVVAGELQAAPVPDNGGYVIKTESKVEEPALEVKETITPPALKPWDKPYSVANGLAAIADLRKGKSLGSIMTLKGIGPSEARQLQAIADGMTLAEYEELAARWRAMDGLRRAA